MKKLIIFDLDDTLVQLDLEVIDCHDDFLNLLNIDLKNKKEVMSEMVVFFKNFNIHFKDKRVSLEETKELLFNMCPFIKRYQLSVDEVILSLFDATIGGTIEIKGAREILEYLKRKEYEMCILTNWFEYVQVGKLRRTDLHKYFKKVLCVDNRYLKPNSKALNEVLNDNKREDCIIIGNKHDEDVLLGYNNDIDTIWLNKEGIRDTNIKATYVIGNLNELKQIL